MGWTWGFESEGSVGVHRLPNVVRTAKSHSNISSCLGRGGDGGQESEGDIANIKSKRRGREEMEPREESGNQINVEEGWEE